MFKRVFQRLNSRNPVYAVLNRGVSNSVSAQVVGLPSVPMDARRVCIVGSGPSAFYTAKYQQQQDPSCYIHIVEKLPVPFGLVRHGIAPDHPEAKAVINDFTNNVLENSRVEFIGNVTVGVDVTLDQLKQAYTFVILAVGASEGKKLGIPGEEEHMMDARDFVMWYNGDPYTPLPGFDLRGTLSAVVVGNGNVSLDVARLLLLPPGTWHNTDVPLNVRTELESNTVQEVHIVARKNVTGAAWTIAEQREILTLLKGTDYKVLVHDGYVDANDERMTERPIKRKTELQMGYPDVIFCSEHENNLQVSDLVKQGKKILHLHFNCTPMEANEYGLVVKTSKGAVTSIPGTVIMKSIGSAVSPIPSVELSPRGTIATKNGHMRDNVYAVGWANRGSVGIVGTHIGEANMLVSELMKTNASLPLNTVQSVWDSVDKHVVTFSQWKNIHQHEIKLGIAQGQTAKE